MENFFKLWKTKRQRRPRRLAGLSSKRLKINVYALIVSLHSKSWRDCQKFYTNITNPNKLRHVSTGKITVNVATTSTYNYLLITKQEYLKNYLFNTFSPYYYTIYYIYKYLEWTPEVPWCKVWYNVKFKAILILNSWTKFVGNKELETPPAFHPTLRFNLRDF